MLSASSQTKRVLTGAVLLEQNDEWLLQHCYMQIEGMAELWRKPATLRIEC